MADGNGKKDPIEQVVDHLAALRTEMKSELQTLRAEVASELGAVRSEIGELRNETRLGMTRLELRLDRVIENTGGHYRRLEERVAALEAKAH